MTIKITLPIFQFEQPGGTFYAGVMSVKDILNIYTIKTRGYDNEKLIDKNSLQRDLSDQKTEEIKRYALDVDATFPTPIIFAINSSDARISNNVLEFFKTNNVADVIDGQHRIKGLQLAYKEQPEYFNSISLPVVFMFDAELEQKAYIFATINSKQTKVSSSLIAELYGVTSKRTPRRIAHEIARAMNASKESPFYRRLKMLGNRSSDDGLESLSQGTFVRELVNKISTNPDEDASFAKRGERPPIRDGAILNSYFRNEEDDVILKLMVNIFGAIKKNWKDEWNDPGSYILTKTAGFEAVMKSLDKLIEKGESSKDLSFEYFDNHFSRVRKLLKSKNIQLDNKNFPSQRAGVDRLSRYMLLDDRD